MERGIPLADAAATPQVGLSAALIRQQVLATLARREILARDRTRADLDRAHAASVRARADLARARVQASAATLRVLRDAAPRGRRWDLDSTADQRSATRHSREMESTAADTTPAITGDMAITADTVTDMAAAMVTDTVADTDAGAAAEVGAGADGDGDSELAGADGVGVLAGIRGGGDLRTHGTTRGIGLRRTTRIHTRALRPIPWDHGARRMIRRATIPTTTRTTTTTEAAIRSTGRTRATATMARARVRHSRWILPIRVRSLETSRFRRRRFSFI
jgi:hypothetical protein